nr:immunoglobulin heavy chain junction region [Mus musculus]
CARDLYYYGYFDYW